MSGIVLPDRLLGANRHDPYNPDNNTK